MITAIDSNILIDVLIPGEPFSPASQDALNAAAVEGALIVSEAVYAEIAAHFPDPDALDEFLNDTGIRLIHSPREALYRAGLLWSTYARDRRHAAASRARVAADFLIGAHAETLANRLLTRDRGVFRKSFPDLEIIEP